MSFATEPNKQINHTIIIIIFYYYLNTIEGL